MAKADSLLETSDMVAQEFRSCLGADATSVHLLRPDGYFEMVASTGCSQEYIAEWKRVPRSMIPLANVAQPEGALFVETAERFKDELPAADNLINKARRHTIGYAPLTVKGKVTGILGFSFNEEPKHPIDRKFTLAVVHICSQALERARLFEEERAARFEAEAANQAKSRFIASVSHEIRSPIAVIQGFAALLCEVKDLDPVYLQWANHIRRNSEQLLNIIGDVLDLSKIEAEKIECEVIPFSIASILKDVEECMGPKAKDKGVGLRFLNFDLPEKITSDPTRVRQIVVNLVGNALKFTLAGEVLVSSRVFDGRLQIEVKDTGIGIPPEKCDKIFEPYTQAETATSRKFGGTGLGLSISKRLAHALGGSLWLQHSQPGKGSVFVFALPCERPRPQVCSPQPQVH